MRQPHLYVAALLSIHSLLGESKHADLYHQPDKPGWLNTLYG
jgi:hypothetical protein